MENYKNTFRLVALKIEEFVDFKGRITPNEHRSLLGESYMFVQHSKTATSGDSEGTPVAILEASAAGLPIVSTIHAGIPDVVINDKTGFLVQENDIDQMAEKILYLLRNKEIAIKFGKKGKDFVFNNFSLDKHIETLTKSILD